MLFNSILAIPLFTFAQSSIASAIVARSTGPSLVAAEVTEIGVIHPGVAIKVANKTMDLSLFSSNPIRNTSPNPRLKSLAATADPQLLICSAQNCAGSCTEFDIIHLSSACESGGFEFLSAAIISSTFVFEEVFVAQAGCTDSAAIPQTNTCFNLELNGVSASFIDFFVSV